MSRRAVGTAYLARLIAGETDADVETAFLTGMLHDIGKLVILKTAFDHQRRTGGTIHVEERNAALALEATLVTANLAHMIHVPGLRVEDWSQE